MVLKSGAQPITHRFEAGRITVVLGRNHSGKTLLTRTLAGLEAPQAGEIRLGGESLARMSPGERSVALVYQAFVNYPDWTVYDNIASPLKARRADVAEIETTVRTLAGKLQLDGLLDRLPEQLSGGQQQRVAIGRALAKGADVLVMDEPLVNLDYKLREALQVELAALLHELGLTVIYTSSDPRDAFALGDDLVLLAEHCLLQSGTPLALYEAPETPAACDLMSDPRANCLPGSTDRVRPEHLHLEGRPGDIAFPVRVLGVETNGSETFLHAALADWPADVPADSHWVARLPGLVSLAAGTEVTLHAAEASLHRFSDTGPEVRRG